MPTTSQLARDYAKAAVRMVEAVEADVRGLGEEQNVSLYTLCRGGSADRSFGDDRMIFDS